MTNPSVRHMSYAGVIAFHLLFEAVLQGNAAVEHQVLSAAVAVIETEVAHTHELEGGGVDAGTVVLLVKLGSGSDFQDKLDKIAVKYELQ